MPMTVTAGEMLVRLAISFDKRGLKEAQTAIGKVDAAIKSFGVGLLGITAALAGGRLFGAFVQRASDANETMNVLEETMGGHVDSIVDWSRKFGKGVGRSEFQLQKYASQIAALVTPALGASESARDMSTGLAQLAVDLASFFNVADDQVALDKLRSGLTGQVKPLRDFGINMLQSNLQAFALSEGIRKNVKDMTEAERLTLRYNFILAHTQAAQGDAARTALMFANAVRGARDALVDVGTRVGFAFVGDVNKALLAIKEFAFNLSELEDKTQIVSNAFKFLSLMIGTLFAPTIFKFLAGFALKFFPIIAAATALFFIFDEIVSFFEGDFTVVGTMLDTGLGPGTARRIRNEWAMTWGILKNDALNYFNFVMDKQDDWNAGMSTLQGIWFDVFGSIYILAKWVFNKIRNAFAHTLNWLKTGAVKVFNLIPGMDVEMTPADMLPIVDAQADLEKDVATLADMVKQTGRLKRALAEGREVKGLTYTEVKTTSGGVERVRTGRTKSEERILAERVNRSGKKAFDVTMNVYGEIEGKDLPKIKRELAEEGARVAKSLADRQETRVEAEDVNVIPEYVQSLDVP